ncbi:LPS export ABC transporter periplasmic protein LptC [Treponema sp.]|uniref:LPS export ABC transporter periplasmic protein LptC n=1 Tax=Treponema sp. TaxID=166 RepID=UPI003FA1FCDA
MKLLPVFIVFLCISCSFNYQDLPEQTVVQPDMIFSNVTLKRYSNALTDLNVYAKALEMYDEEKIWAGKNILFVQYDEKTQKESMKGETGILYIDEKAEEYSLGGSVFFHLIEDDLSIRSPALIWKKKESLLAAPAEETVSITQKDEVTIEGKSFAANTAAKEFSFAEGSSGTIIIKEKEPVSEEDTNL